MKQLLPIFTLVCIASGCSTLQGPDYGVYDKNENFNRATYRLTDRVDRNILAPVARGYQRITPNWLERAITNFYQNLRTPDSMINGVLQGKPKAGAIDFGRFMINSTLGIGGLVDIASKVDLPFQNEDLGQTLAVWGVKKSRYIFIPLLGPTTLRDLPSNFVSGLFPRLILGDNYGFAVASLDLVNARAQALGATDVRDASALDPYTFTRDAYYQRRKFLIYDGDLPVDDLFDEFGDEFEDEEFEDTTTTDSDADIE